MALRWLCKNGMCVKNNTIICVARASNSKRDCEHDLYCCLLPRCEALRTSRSGFPIATQAKSRCKSIVCVSTFWQLRVELARTSFSWHTAWGYVCWWSHALVKASRDVVDCGAHWRGTFLRCKSKNTRLEATGELCRRWARIKGFPSKNLRLNTLVCDWTDDAVACTVWGLKYQGVLTTSEKRKNRKCTY